MKYALLDYVSHDKFNVGDYIQSLAAKQFLPHVDYYVNREKLNSFKEQEAKVILNGWFTHDYINWTPTDLIKPLFVSFHLNAPIASRFLDSKCISYLKKHSPIGCRDMKTVDILTSKGIDAYFTGCMTLTLGHNRKLTDDSNRQGIYIVDPFFNIPEFRDSFKSIRSLYYGIRDKHISRSVNKRKYLKSFIDTEVLENAEYLTHVYPPANMSTEDKFKLAEDLLDKYSKAKLVITSRIHCALPCLALGTPVIFINGFDNEVDTCRFGGLLDLFNRIDFDVNNGLFTSNFIKSGKITTSTHVVNSDKYKFLANSLINKCEEFVNQY